MYTTELLEGCRCNVALNDSLCNHADDSPGAEESAGTSSTLNTCSQSFLLHNLSFSLVATHLSTDKRDPSIPTHPLAVTDSWQRSAKRLTNRDSLSSTAVSSAIMM